MYWVSDWQTYRELALGNPFVNFPIEWVCWQLNLSTNSHPFLENCSEFVTHVDPEDWGQSGVEQLQSMSGVWLNVEEEPQTCGGHPTAHRDDESSHADQGALIRHNLYMYINENHDLAIARSSSSHADPGLRVAFKCLNV